MPKVQANDIEIYYEVHGEGDPLVLVPGLGSSTRDWEFQIPEFSRSYQVITFDLRGHGQSEKPPGPYQMTQFAADLDSLMDTLGIGRFHLVGMSLGGCVAFQFAVDYPQKIKTLTIANSVPTFHSDPEVARQEVERRTDIVRQMGMRGMGQALGEVHFPKPEQATLRETFVERWAENDPEAYIEATRSIIGWDVTDRLGAIHCPTLVIASDDDIWPLEVKEAYVEQLPDARLVVIEDAHHVVIREHHEAFNLALKEFLAQQGTVSR